MDENPKTLIPVDIIGPILEQMAKERGISVAEVVECINSEMIVNEAREQAKFDYLN